MKTRIIHTKLFRDTYYLSLPTKFRPLFFFLISNEWVGLTPYYEIPLQIVLLCSGLTAAEYEQAKKKFIHDKKFLFFEAWVFIVNYEKYQSFKGGKLEVAYKKELERVPEKVKKYCIDTVSGDVDRVSIGYQYPSDTPNNIINNKYINNKEEIINIKEGVVKGKPKLADITEEKMQEIATAYQVPLAFVHSKYDDMQNYCNAKGKTYRDYEAALRNWVKRDALERRDKFNGNGQRYHDSKQGIDARHVE